MVEDFSLRTMLEKFKQAMAVKNYSPRTIEIRHNDLMRFIKWCDERALEDVRVINKAEIERYQRWLSAYRRSTDGHRLNIESQLRFISSLRMFFQWLSRKEFILRNPTEDVELPRKGKRIPKAILTRQEVEVILKQPDLNTDRGIRDRAILETLYSTGIRREELIKLKLEDLDMERGMLAIRCGKGTKDRIIPIGERAVLWIEKYLLEVRARVANTGETALFINHRGQGLGTMGLAWLAREYIKQANIGKRGTCHIFRHTCATLMLEGGADIRYIQQMLGHEDLSTTQLYTRVYDRKLKEVHNQSHPGAQLKHKPTKTEEPEE